MIDGFAENIVVTREALCDHMGLGGFAQGWVNRLAEQVPVEELRPVEQLEVAGRRAQLRTVGWQAAGLDITQLAALFIDGEDAFAVVGTCAAPDLDTFERAFREVLAGIALPARAY